MCQSYTYGHWKYEVILALCKTLIQLAPASVSAAYSNMQHLCKLYEHRCEVRRPSQASVPYR